ncbi:hypothetical protein [Neisseria montereyensis]|uniref:Uncharacterized protein n=1 Tax=Neisseria montereyensis TaxID=2973938 RepID=A0ABT2FAU5_9NEIS|nr:hypothetical protein [Neisseria montereyensis]MCS4533291.1 hypothetical protein [Neisseria montereyensis]
MKKTMLTFAALATLATSFASARGAHMPRYDHTNDSGAIAGLQETNNDAEDSIQLIAPRTGIDDSAFKYNYQYLGRTTSR